MFAIIGTSQTNISLLVAVGGRVCIIAVDLVITLPCTWPAGSGSPLQVTVNNQIVVGTLMNLCDDPNRVSVYQEWRDSDFVQRVPIIVTGNDLSHMFAPLIRDGRMSKFYWKPDRVDLSNILHQMYQVSTMYLSLPKVPAAKAAGQTFFVQVLINVCTHFAKARLYQQINSFRMSVIQ